MSELEEDIKHCEEVLANWKGCDECKADHERLLLYMKELLEYRDMRHLNKDTLYKLTSKVEGSIYRAEPFKITDVGELLALQKALRLLYKAGEL